MSARERTALGVIRDLFENGLDRDLDRWLASDVWLAPPTYFGRWHGRDAVGRLLRHAAANLGDFRYEAVWADATGAALVFEATVDSLAIRGVDVVHLDDAGLVTGIEIAARPPNAVAALATRMGAAVAADPDLDKPHAG